MSKRSDLAYERIRERIIAGEYRPGAHLKEEFVAADVGVSRTPVREALRRLSTEHLVQFRPNRGAYVSSWSLDDVEEIYMLRAALEGQAAFRAATRITPIQIDQLTAHADTIDELLGNESDTQRRRIADANHEFHQLILAAAHSERLTHMLSWLVAIPITLHTFEQYTPSEIARSNHHHREMVDAFKVADAGWAQKIMEMHLYAAQRLYMEHSDN